jgi:hypothetical protein
MADQDEPVRPSHLRSPDNTLSGVMLYPASRAMEVPVSKILSVPIPDSASATLLGWRLEDHDAEKGWVRIAFEGRRDFVNPARTGGLDYDRRRALHDHHQYDG